MPNASSPIPRGSDMHLALPPGSHRPACMGRGFANHSSRTCSEPGPAIEAPATAMTTLAYASPAHKPSSALECTVGIPSTKKKGPPKEVKKKRTTKRSQKKNWRHSTVSPLTPKVGLLPTWVVPRGVLTNENLAGASDLAPFWQHPNRHFANPNSLAGDFPIR